MQAGTVTSYSIYLKADALESILDQADHAVFNMASRKFGACGQNVLTWVDSLKPN